jgi:hypothetical protein
MRVGILVSEYESGGGAPIELAPASRIGPVTAEFEFERWPKRWPELDAHELGTHGDEESDLHVSRNRSLPKKRDTDRCAFLQASALTAKLPPLTLESQLLSRPIPDQLMLSTSANKVVCLETGRVDAEYDPD